MLNWNSGDVTVTHSANTLAFAGASSGYTFDVPIAATSGGTGLSTYTTGDIPYASAANTLSKLAAGTAGYSLIQGTSIPEWRYTFPRGYIDGLKLSNNGTDATNDIDIAAGVAADGGNAVLIQLSSALTKQLDATWAVGTNAGMRASGAAIADTTYHIFLIRRTDTGVVDIAADTSVTGANIAANTNAAYTQIRRIGSIVRTGAAIKAFTQVGDDFLWSTYATDRSSTAAVAWGLITLTLPVGIQVSPIMTGGWEQATAGQIAVAVGSAADTGDASEVLVVFSQFATEKHGWNVGAGGIFTDTSARINFRTTITGGTITTNILYTRGWRDLRGKNA